MSDRPFDDFRRLLRHLNEPDRAAEAATRASLAALEPRHGGFGRLGDLAAWHSAWRGKSPPMILRPTVAVFAGSNATGDVAGNMALARDLAERAGQGGAAVNALCRLNNLALKVLDLALDLPVGDITVQAALEERAAAATMAFGMEAVAGGADLIGFASIGPGHAVHAAALAMRLAGLDASEFAADIAGPAQRAAARHGDAADPFEALARLGTREIAAIAGAILAARVERIPVLLDGEAALAAALVLHAADPRALAHCRLAAALPRGFDHAAALIGLDPVVDFGWSLVGGAGAALAASAVRAAAQLAVEMR